jgi:hypothetical protein
MYARDMDLPAKADMNTPADMKAHAIPLQIWRAKGR